MMSSSFFFLLALSFLVKFGTSSNLEWWKVKPIYQIYPYSFKDSDGDGIGDLPGIRSQVDHFKEMGVGGVWLSPIYESPGKDNGYDISNFKSISKIFGNMTTFDDLVKSLNDTGIKLIMDFVPNHTSDEHPWFKESMENDTNQYSDYYIWRKPKNNDVKNPTPPNNWKSLFGGSAWKFVPKRKQYYYHAFGEFQPDLNYNNQKVIKEMQEVLEFWMKKGVYGFRMDAVNFIMEDKDLKDEPQIGNSPDPGWGDFNHTYTLDQSGTYDVLAQFRTTLNNYSISTNNSSRLMMIEAYSPIDKTMKYYGTKDKPIANFPFNFFLFDLNQNSKGSDFVDKVNDWLKNMPKDAWPNWVLGNHDKSRVGTRMGKELIDGMNMMSLLLPGTAITYNGEELGMTDTYVRPNERKDKTNQNRDSQRTPFQWSRDKNAGFSNASPEKLYLPINPNYWSVNLKNEKGQELSHYNIYKRLSKLRQKLIENGNLDVSNLGQNYTFSFMRTLSDKEKYIVVLNLDNKETTVDAFSHFNKIPEKMFVHTKSINSDKNIGDQVSSKSFKMRPKESLVIYTSTASIFQGTITTILIALAILLPRLN